MTPRNLPARSTAFPHGLGPVSRRIVTLIERQPGIRAAEIAADVYRDGARFSTVYGAIREIRRLYLPPGWRIRSRPGPLGGGYWLETGP